MAGELVAEAVEEGLPVEEGVGAPDGRPLRRRAPAQDTDQSGLVRAPSCNSAHQRQRPSVHLHLATPRRKETGKKARYITED